MDWLATTHIGLMMATSVLLAAVDTRRKTFGPSVGFAAIALIFFAFSYREMLNAAFRGHGYVTLPVTVLSVLGGLVCWRLADLLVARRRQG